MEKIIQIGTRGKLEIKNSIVKCFLGNIGMYKSSESIKKELENKEISGFDEFYTIDKEKYLIYNPIPEKNISIITNDGKAYKSTVYFVDDIKNIIEGLHLINPCYLFENKYNTLKTENNYAKFLFNDKSSEIKDIENEKIDFKELEDAYNKFQLENYNTLKDINKNIYLYSKIDNIGEEKFFFTYQRTSLNIDLNTFYENKERNEISDVIYGIFGNYASGKSFFLIFYNYKVKFPSIYLNLKALKNAFKTKGFSNLLNNELMCLFKKSKKSYDDYKNFISSLLPYETKEFDQLIISIIEKLKVESAIIILDQYQEKIFSNKSFIIQLKKILFNKNSKIKVIISSSMNDGPIREAYLDIIFNNKVPNYENTEEEKEQQQEPTEIEVEEEIEEKEEEKKEEEKKEEEKKEEEKREEEKTKKEDEQEKKKKEETDMEISDKTKIKKKGKKFNNFIPYHFVERLVGIEEIKKNIKSIKKENDKAFNDKLKLFNYLPLYYSLCRNNIDNLENFEENTIIRIKKKILKFNKDEKFNLINFDFIRKAIDNEITINDLRFYSKYIPFKYFYIQEKNDELILRTHFPLVKDVWNNIIINNTVNLFDGEIKYDGNVIGSLMELNLIINIKKKVIQLDIDSFIKVDTIYNFGTFIENDTDDFKNKNILITQNNQNGKYFDIAYIQGKNVDNPKLIFIQVKKSLSENKVTKEKMKLAFEEKKDNFFKLFNFTPKIENVNLVYISLYNNEIRQALLAHDNYKKDKDKKVGDLGKDINSVVYSINELYNFCLGEGIQLYYYEPKTHLFYIKNNNNFEQSQLDLTKESKNELYYLFNFSYLFSQLQENKNNTPKINKKYQDFLKQKRKRSFSYEIEKFDFEIVFKFAEIYFQNINIINYIDLQKAHSDSKYCNLSNNQAIICLKKNENKYEVDSFIYKNYNIKLKGDQLTLNNKNNNILDRDNDFLVGISFDNISKKLKEFLK